MNNFKGMNNDYILKRTQINGVEPSKNVQNTQNKSIPEGPSFNEVLNKIKSNEDVKFSKHAIDRLNSRNINLTDQEINRINTAIDKAGQKGVKEALIMMDNKVFIASVQNKTIITAAVDDQLRDSVFTNIDGAVII
ncbi:TIGR02530 family flagellar biosynthesis protein [Fusibacter sp. 3D3]|uniref:TIGR02530 family flagellar biosynthesis protein n=1 Tax=Fusibacter sp. 3D3 TaxID=1048380 RepID=UPI000855EBAA|nr:TIGR02530 family flagellar biosynthesis protein [Fusibacter sp. 3D3]GAU79871.1 putative flagellar hook associated protein [Fusibacter sp. 3D3]